MLNNTCFASICRTAQWGGGSKLMLLAVLGIGFHQRKHCSGAQAELR
jgi:hypothetical protein